MLTVAGLFLGICNLYAQEGQFPGNNEQEPRPTTTTSEERVEGGMQIWDNGSSANETTTSLRPVAREGGDQPPVKEPENASENVGNTKGGDDSVLSFNFLYYLIQKFKLSETVE